MSEQTPNTPNQNPKPVAPVKKSNNKMALLVGFLAIVIIIQGIKIYLDSQEKQEVKEQLTSTEEQYATTMQRLTEIQAEFDLKIAEIEKLGGDVRNWNKPGPRLKRN
jgi:cell division protein ZapB